MPVASNKSSLYLIWYDLLFRLLGRKYTAFIDITNRCNLRCKYCYHKKFLTEKDDIPIAEWEKRFKKYQKMGIRDVFFVGGEPALRYDALRLAEKYFPHIASFTNGQIKIPREFNHRIILSLDGLKEQNDSNRGKGTYERAVNNYEGDKRVIIVCTISKKNHKDLEKFIEEVRKINIQGVVFNSYIPEKNEDNSLILAKKEREEVKKVLLKELGRNNSILLMTKGMVDDIVEAGFRNRCVAKEKILFFSADDKPKYCSSEKFDCSRCNCIPARFTPASFGKPDWFRQKKVLYDWMFRLK